VNWNSSGDEANHENTLIIHNPVRVQAFWVDFQHLYAVLGPWMLCEVEVGYLLMVRK
jgi:hypothetical protein